MRRSARGLTLIELLIVLAIVGVLAGLAIPAYRDSVTRAKVSEGLALLAPVKAAVVEYHAVHGHLPTSSNWLALLRELGLPVSTAHGAASGVYVERIWWNQAAQQIRVRFKVAPIQGKRVAMTASVTGGIIRWDCTSPQGSEGVPARFLPVTCRH
ncbi:pilin [Algiphilus sp.]|uniref:pilin n=1 Tax=Algiphilus sp. TaxID=1872431 RepID=UPI002A6878F2|nr:pilin [Pseudomonadota bacterium]